MSQPQAINVAIGNHFYGHGIGEILYTLKQFFARLSGRYRVTFSPSLVPDQINILIDEFSTAGVIAYVQKFKKDYPATKLVLIATEFITPVSFLGRQLGPTFNFFDPREDRKYAFEILGYQRGRNKNAPYMYSRFMGFREAMRLVDLVVAVHPAIIAELPSISDGVDHWVAPPTDLYPEIDAPHMALESRLKQRRAGFVMTGTLTPFRKSIVDKLIKIGHRIGIPNADKTLFAQLPFDHKSAFELRDGSATFPFEEAAAEPAKSASAHPDSADGYLFNLNPPQRANWPFSSPMRILRAVLYGQIPLVTRKFGDHELEAVAMVWNPDAGVEPFAELWHEATLGRDVLIARHISAITDYNDLAKQKNAAVERALEAL
ncbi:MAG TPA: hypothetical protein VGG12_01765 [Methylovirgula sp.]